MNSVCVLAQAALGTLEKDKKDPTVAAVIGGPITWSAGSISTTQTSYLLEDVFCTSFPRGHVIPGRCLPEVQARV